MAAEGDRHTDLGRQSFQFCGLGVLESMVLWVWRLVMARGCLGLILGLRVCDSELQFRI